MNNNFYNIPENWYKEFNNTFVNSSNMNNMMNNMNTGNLASPREGFLRGNLFNNLYDPYKNYRYRELMPKNKREELLYDILKYNFALVELNLYLDTNPNDRGMLDLYNRYLSEEKKLYEEYEKKYGPLTIGSRDAAGNKWNWIESPWPWEVMR